MSEDKEITTNMHKLLTGYIEVSEADQVLRGINALDESDFAKFIELMSQWNNCRWNESR